MRLQLYAAEPTSLIAALERMQNATELELRTASGMFGEEDDDEEDPVDDIYDEEDGEACIRVEGLLSMSGPSPIARLFGVEGCSYKAVIEACHRAAASACNRVAFEFNSPGGDVTGVDLAYQAIAALAKAKPCTARVMGMCASAAYYLASACPRIEAMAPTCEIGSIGVKIVAIDDTEAMKADGYKRVTIVSKNAPNKDADVATKSGRDILQARADAVEGVFLARVAEGRGVTPEYVAGNFGKGGLLIASEAMRVRMVDAVRMEIASPTVPDSASRILAAQSTGRLVAQADTTKSHQEGKHMTLQEFLASDPVAKAAYDQALVEARAAGKAEAQAMAKKVGVYLTSDVYSKSKPIVDRAIKALSGEASFETVEAVVAMFDLQAEQNKTTAAAHETKVIGETPPAKLEANAELLARAAKVGIDTGKIAQIEAACKEAKTDPNQALLGEIEMLEAAAKSKGSASSVRGL